MILGRHWRLVRQCYGFSRPYSRASFSGDPSNTRSAATWQTIEEYDEATQMPTASYIHGIYIDEVLSMRRADGSGAIRDFYYHQDDLFNVTLVTDASGAAVERYDYGDYGTPRFFDGGGAALAASAIGNPRLFNGRAWGAAVALYYYRTRYLEPSLGRFTARDTIGGWGDEGNAGNALSFVASSSPNHIDPFGLVKVEQFYKPVAFGKYHKFIIVTQSDGSQYLFRGGPRKGGNPLTQPIRTTGSGPLTPNSFDRPDGKGVIRHPTPILDDPNQDGSELVKRMTQTCAEIDASNTNYDLLGPNSNSTVRTILEDNDLTVPPSSYPSPGDDKRIPIVPRYLRPLPVIPPSPEEYGPPAPL